MTIRPAIVNDPDRAGPPFTVASKDTVPLPMPVPRLARASQGGRSATDHEHPGFVVTATVAGPPRLVKD